MIKGEIFTKNGISFEETFDAMKSYPELELGAENNSLNFDYITSVYTSPSAPVTISGYVDPKGLITFQGGAVLIIDNIQFSGNWRLEDR